MAAMSSIGSKVKGMFSRKKKKEDRNSLIHNESSLYSSPISAGVGRFEPPSIPATSSSVSYNGYGQSGGSANGSTYKASPPSTGTSSRSTSGSRNKKGKKSSSKNRRGGGDSDSTGEQGSPTSVLGERVQTLVEKLTVDSGVRVVPVRAVLTEFTDQVSNLDPKLVARALLAKLKSATPWKTKVVCFVLHSSLSFIVLLHRLPCLLFMFSLCVFGGGGELTWADSVPCLELRPFFVWILISGKHNCRSICPL